MIMKTMSMATFRYWIVIKDPHVKVKTCGD